MSGGAATIKTDRCQTRKHQSHAKGPQWHSITFIYCYLKKETWTKLLCSTS